MNERELPMLAAIGGFFRWWEELLTIIAAPLLMAGLLIALVALLTNGSLLTTQPELVYAWAIAMGVGVDAQLIGASAKLGQAALSGRPWQVVGYTVLVLPLAYVAFVAAQVFATQQAEGITTSAALSQLGMDPTAWLIQRSALSVALVVLSGVLRYRSKGQATIMEERAKLARELELEPLRQQVRAGKALGMAALARNTALAMAGKAPTERPPTGPGTPTAQPGVRTPAESHAARADAGETIHLIEPSEWREQRRKQRTANAERKVRNLLAREPRLSAHEIARRLRISDSTASKYRRLLESESQAEERIAR